MVLISTKILLIKMRAYILPKKIIGDKMQTRTVVCSLALILITGCKIELEVSEGGSVTTVSGAYSCSSGQACVAEDQ